MKTSYATAIALAIAALTAGQAMAADNTVGKTREQVKTELAQYRAAHKNDVYDAEIDMVSNNSIQPAPSTVTRAEVRAELAAHQAAHRFDVVDSETNLLVASAVPEATSDVSRAEVKTELAQYQADHRFDVYDSETHLQMN